MTDDSAGKNVVFVSSISGSDTSALLGEVAKIADSHGHEFRVHDVGAIIDRIAAEEMPHVNRAAILDVEEPVLALMRRLAMERIASAVDHEPDATHVIDLHLCFRWKSYLTRGLDPHALEPFRGRTRLFLNIVEDVTRIQSRLSEAGWGERTMLELLIWRDEEMLLADLFADMLSVRSIAVSRNEPPAVHEALIWHPERPKAYLSFPITGVLGDPEAQARIRDFHARVVDLLTVFDPYACKDYDETYTHSEMGALRKAVGDQTEDRDYRLIDQADVVIVYLPSRVESKGVEGEMNHALRTGKPIFLCSQDGYAGQPFNVKPTFHATSADEVLAAVELWVADQA